MSIPISLMMGKSILPRSALAGLPSTVKFIIAIFFSPQSQATPALEGSSSTAPNLHDSRHIPHRMHFF
jgi:hypothetical protein